MSTSTTATQPTPTPRAEPADAKALPPAEALADPERFLAALSPLQARELLEAMGQQGQPPARGALLVNVATGPLLQAVAAAHLEPLAQSPRLSTMKLVLGSYGSGKTQLLSALREVGWSLGFAAAHLELSPERGAFDKMDLLYRRVATEVALPPERFDAEPARGLPRVLDAWLAARRAEASDEELRDWIGQELASAQVDSPSFLSAAVHYLLARLDGKEGKAGALRAWLLGEPTGGKREKETLRRLQVRETLSAERAMDWLVALAQLLRALDVPGLLLLFDEGERLATRTRKKERQRIAENLRSFVDLVAQKRLPGVFAVYAATGQFFDDFAEQYPALAQRFDRRFPATARTPEGTVVDLSQLEIPERELRLQLAGRMLRLARQAYPSWQPDLELQRRNLTTLVDASLGGLDPAGERRRLVRAVYRLLLEQRHRPGTLRAAAARALLGREEREIEPMEGEQDALEHRAWDDEEDAFEVGEDEGFEGSDEYDSDEYEYDSDEYDEEDDDELD